MDFPSFRPRRASGVIFLVISFGCSMRPVLAAADAYPPAGFEKEETVVESPDEKFSIEQWWDTGQSLYQTWLVPKSGEPVRLPEVKLSKEMGVEGDSGSVGFPSDFSFSPDGQYLFREQKIVHGINGAYLYRCGAGLAYKAVVPNLHLRASKFFTRATKLEWHNGTGIVEFSSWEANAGLALKLRGYSRDRKFAIENWRCVFYPATDKFTIPPDWTAKNKEAITRQ
jgi:hypothetical protein